MAFDEAMLARHRPGDHTLRVYGWRPHALSLGYFQSASQAEAILNAFPDLVLTRRPTGGGAIIHADEVTWALVADAPGTVGASRDLYRRMNAAIVEALGKVGVGAAERGGAPGSAGSAFLCFERHADFDVTVGDRKIAGSAQRRRGEALLQHGSILLGPPPLGGPKVCAASTIAGRRIEYATLTPLLVDAVRRSFDRPFEEQEPPPSLLERAQALRKEKFGTEAWIHRR
jgi:lipoate-protein ligase A